MSPPPPYSLGKPMPVWPVAAISTTTSLTRSRKSWRLRVSASSRIEAYSARLVAHQVADLGVLPVEEARQRGHVDLELAVGDAPRRARIRWAEACRWPWPEATSGPGRAKKFGVIQ